MYICNISISKLVFIQISIINSAANDVAHIVSQKEYQYVLEPSGSN
jgi:hypothetical protein